MSIEQMQEGIIQDNCESKGRSYFSIQKPKRKYKSASFFAGWADIEKTKALAAWRNRIGKDAAQAITNKAATSGTKIHSANEGKDVELTNVEKKKQMFHQNLMDKIQITFQEQKILWIDPEDDEVGFGGTFDCLAYIPTGSLVQEGTDYGVSTNKYMIIDWKNSKIKEAGMCLGYYLQASAYMAGLNQLTNKEFAVTEGLISVASSRTHKIMHINQEQSLWYWKNFKEIVRCYAKNEKFDWYAFADESRGKYDPETAMIKGYLPNYLEVKK